jgi:tyrosine-protein kinase Etk/Wzc
MTTKEEQPLFNGMLPEKTIDINRLMMVLTVRWYFPVIGILLAVSIAYLQLRYTKPIYSAKLTMKFDDDKGGSMNDLFKYGRVSGRIENLLKTEAEVMKSRSMAKRVLIDLNMDISAFAVGDIVTSRLYPNRFFECRILHLDSSEIGHSFSVRFSNSGTFHMLSKNGTESKIEYSSSDTIHLGKSSFLIIADKEGVRQIDGQPIIINFNDLNQMAAAFASMLNIEIEKNTNIMNMKVESDVPELASDYVNALAKAYINETISNQAKAAAQTIQYIDTQLVELASKVKVAQLELAGFKSNNKGVTPVELGKVQFDRLINFETQKSIQLMRKKQLEALEKNIIQAKNKTVELIVFDVEDANQLDELFILMNELILERISNSSRQKANSPFMQENERKISEVKAALIRALGSIKQNLDSRIAHNNAQIATLSDQLSGLPDKEQALFNLDRTFKINEKIYGYLQEKRLENLISMSSITSKASVIDQAMVNHSPIFPIPKRNYIIAILIGFGAGIGLIFLNRLVYDKVTDKVTIELLSKTPVIGVVKKVADAQEGGYRIYTLDKPKSIFAESMRGIRTNLNFILQGQKNKFITVTSSVSGEGKTFCTINLAASLTLLGNKVLIVGCDLRRPKIHLSFNNIDNNQGLTTFLIGKHSIAEVIKPTEYDNLYVMPAGPVPPNPAELLQSDQFEKFLQTIRNDYDFVFFDTAPVGLVSDSFSMLSYADVNLFIIRSQYSKRDFALIPDRLSGENNIKNMYIILNSFDSSSAAYSSIYRTEYGGYYGGGGYYYYGGYYGKETYGFYGRKYYNNYYSGYYSDDFAEKGIIRKAIAKIYKKFKSKT